ncbi:hypothetical protein J3R30DRAFT_3553072 [Lentinula aciculospora]|uniref:Uncharacterized protein n=1 Tax=Lentinula aciculospora TaxID=153920 RepID=A0A9W9DH66_9AGAR|nr:hypothetical protein J3R30DRAFT_3553072 [Lentinula aciculospora]
MRITIYYLAFISVLGSAAYAAPVAAGDSSLDVRAPSSHLDITIAFKENPFEGIQVHLTQAYTNIVKEDVRSLVKNIAGRDLGAPVGTALLFHWVGTPSPDTRKPVQFDVSTTEHGRYQVLMSHRTPTRDFIVKDMYGHTVRELGDPERNP